MINNKQITVDLQEAAQIYDQQYRRDVEGDRLEVFYNDGTVQAYSAKDGSLMWERKEKMPNGTLDEEFYTQRWRIAAPLHGTPVIYDRETGKEIGTLEPDAFLTYVTETGPYVITEYISSQGERYGLLLNEEGQTLARLPGLCDGLEDMLIFDDGVGNLRSSPIYTLDELMELAQNH